MYNRMVDLSVRWMLMAVLAMGVAVSSGCGDDEEDRDQDHTCEADTDCDGQDVCLVDTCIDAPEEGMECPAEYDGETYDGLECADGVWQIPEQDDETLELELVDQPPAEVVAGESFDVAVTTIREDGSPAEEAGIDVGLTVSEVSFAGGEDELVEETDESGEASFEVVIEVAATDLVLSAEADAEDVQDSTDSDPFDVLAADPDEATSWIWGEDGVADGQTVSEVTIELFDEFGNAVVGVTPEFTASGDDGDNGYEDCSETDDDGIASCGMTTTQPGEQDLEIVEPVEVVGEEIYFAFDCDEQATPFGGGEGTDDNPHRLCAPEHLGEIYTGDPEYLGDYFELVEDIDMDGVDFEPIGEHDGLGGGDLFYGHFDGNEQTINNLTIDASEDRYAGLFEYIDDGGTVVDLYVDGAEIHGEEDVGVIAGHVRGEISGCRVTDVDMTGTRTLGGIVGAIVDGGRVTSSYTTGMVGDADAERVGGLVGRLFTGEVSDAYSTVEVVGEEAVGGLIGMTLQSGGEVLDSYAAGKVDGQLDVGGMFGEAVNVEAENLYWDIQTSEVDNDDFADPLETDDFGDADADHFEQWDFDDVWEIGEAPDGQQRPILQWQDD